MEPYKSDLPAPHAGEREKDRTQNEQPPTFQPHPVDQADGTASSPGTADDELQRRGQRLEEVEGLTDNKAGG
jgi:hypothetical protein